ncbi:MAG TPA: hypothetical protein VMW50_07400 [Dehalococcoidia bacterium]|nr:hypothetical protein [Dehalococcoidia bacterium]
MNNCLNVKNGEINNKRLSQLQKAILKVLVSIYPDGYNRVGLIWQVAKAYGPSSIETVEMREQKWLEHDHRLFEEQCKQDLEAAKAMTEIRHKFHALEIAASPSYGDRISPKFSVAYHRSWRNLSAQGLIQRWRAKNEWGGWTIYVSLTQKGQELALSRGLN